MIRRDENEVNSWVTYLQVAPACRWCFLLFLVVPIATNRGGELLRLQHDPDHPGLPAAELRGAAALRLVTWQDLSADAGSSRSSPGALTLLIGFTIAYYLAFYVRSPTWADGAVSWSAPIPFWTSKHHPQ